jgi:protein-tyrosine phosphatase
MSFFSRLFGQRGEAGPSDMRALATDMHSHVIPGIDDGAKTIEDSLNMLRGFIALGYRKVITSPHIMSDGYPNTPAIIREGLDKVRAAAQAAGLAIEVEAAAEYYLDEQFEKYLAEGLLHFGGDKRYVLFETSYVSKPLSLRNALFRMQSQQYIPVMAHPERYQYFWEGDALSAIRALQESGVLMQVNIGSFAGRYSKKAAVLARQLTKEGLVDFLGTDMHRAQQAITLEAALKDHRELRDLVGSGRLLNSQL